VSARTEASADIRANRVLENMLIVSMPMSV